MKPHSSRTTIGKVAMGTAVCIALAVTTGCGGSSSAGEGSSSSTADSQWNIAFLGLSGSNTYTTAAFDAAKKEAERLGVGITFFDGQFKSDVQYNQLQDLTTSGKFDGILVMPNDGAALTPVATKAIEAGMKVIAVEFPIGPSATTLDPQIDGITSTIGYDIPGEAEAWANHIVDVCADTDPCNVAFLSGDRTTLFDKIRFDTMTTVFEQHPSVHLLVTVDAHHQRAEGMAAMQTILTAHGDDITVVTGADTMLVGADDAINAAGLQGKYTLVGFATTVDGISRVKSGAWHSDAQPHVPATEGVLAVDMMVDALDGKTVPQSVDMATKSPVGPVATKDNLDANPDFVGEWNG